MRVSFRPIRVLLLPALFGLCIPTTALAQEKRQPLVAEGSRVRVDSPLLEDRLVGTVVALSASHVVIAPERAKNTEFRLLRAQVEGLEVSLGRKSKWLTGGLIGAGVLGGIVTLGVLDVCTADDWDCYSGGEIARGVGLGVALGFAAGAGIGALIRSDRWEEARLPEVEPMVSVLPRRQQSTALAIGLRLRI